MSNRMANIGKHHTSRHDIAAKDKLIAKRQRLGKYATARDIGERIEELNKGRREEKEAANG